MVGLEDIRTNNRTMLPTLKNNAAAGYKCQVKIALLKSAAPDVGVTVVTDEKGELKLIAS